MFLLRNGLVRASALRSRCAAAKSARLVRPNLVNPRWQSRHIHATVALHMDPYKVLGVSRNATESEIKRAYYNLAKEYHPDVSGSKDGGKKFREISAAFAILRDPASRRRFDTTGSTEYDDLGAKEAEDIFTKAWQEFGIGEYIEEVRADAGTALEAARHGDYSLVWDFVKERKGLIFGILVPALAMLRFPGLMSFALRLGVSITIGVLQRVPPQVAYQMFRRFFLPRGGQPPKK